jgi:membrane AbrB-like protein
VRRWITVSVLVGTSCGLLSYLGLPTPMLFGGLVGALAYSLARPLDDLGLPPWAFRLGQALVGVVIGTSIDWTSVGTLGSRWVVVVFVAVFSLVISVAVGQLLVRCGATRVTATFASIAGGAAGLTAMADDLGADDRVVAILQYLRLLAVLVTLPIVVIGVFGVSAERADASTQASPLPTALVFVAASVAIGLPLGRLARLPSAALLGPLTVASILGLFPVFSDPAVPDAAADVGYVLIGVHVGLRFTVRSLLAIGRMLPVALLTIAVTLGACGGLAWVLVATTGVSGLDAYLATTPGGIYAVTGTAAAVSGDVTFVTATQVLRLLIILVSAPLLAVWLRSDRCSGGAPDGLAPRA